MLVKERMTRHPITITPDVSLYDALRIMRDEKVRRLPVLDKRGKLVGIVLERDLLYASPPATSLSVYEMNYLVAKIRSSDLMSREVITIEEDCPLEAARIMVDNNIGGLPVMRGDRLVGMITESDLFKIFWSCWARATPGCASPSRWPSSRGSWRNSPAPCPRRGGYRHPGHLLGATTLASREIAFKSAGDRDVSRVEQIPSTLGADVVDLEDLMLKSRRPLLASNSAARGGGARAVADAVLDLLGSSAMVRRTRARKRWGRSRTCSPRGSRAMRPSTTPSTTAVRPSGQARAITQRKRAVRCASGTPAMARRSRALRSASLASSPA